MKRWTSLVAMGVVCSLSCSSFAQDKPSSKDFSAPQRRQDGKPLSVSDFRAPLLKPTILRRYPHDTQCFTQGLFIDEHGRGFESNGGGNRSSLREFDPRSGQVKRELKLGREYWAEGVCQIESDLLLLTWQNRRFFRYHKDSFQLARTLDWFGEGWGVTRVGPALALSDGSHTIQLLEPSTLKLQRSIVATDGGRPVDLLNELEFIGGYIYANVWPSDYIAIMRPQDGHIVAWLDGHELLTPEEQKNCDMLNGIAYDSARDEIHLTGKLWPQVFVIRRPELLR